MRVVEKAVKISLVVNEPTENLKERNMEELLKNLTGKKIDVSCGAGPILRGEVKEIRGGVLFLRDDDGKPAYVSIDKIASVYECSDTSSRPGFIGS